MYGSIHTHFESQYDTGNDKKEMLKNLIACGAKKVAVTEHGVFSSYEDLRELVDEIKNEAKKNEEPIPDFNIIPGVEGYFEDDAAHLILIAKDYEGYVSLCKIISESNENVKNGKPIITLDNLKRNVNKGHLICSTACIAGPFGRIFGLEYLDLQEKINEIDKELEDSGYRKYNALVEEYEFRKKEEKVKRPTKAEITAAQRILKKEDDIAPLEALNIRMEEANALNLWLQEHKDEKIEAEKKLASMKKAVYARKQTQLEKYKEDLEAYKNKIASGEIEMEARDTLNFFLNTFGKNNFYFELQNHGLEKEDVLYNDIVKFAYRAGHPNFIASNDIHIGVRKEDPNYEDMLLRRNVIKYTRFNKYEEETEDDKEYVIKNNDELKNELLKIIKPVEDALRTVSAEEIVDIAIGNIEKCLSECAIEFPENENHYPKFCDDENAEFEKLVREGLKEKFPNGFPKGKEKIYEERLEYELNVIKEMGYAGYHLIVADYLAYGRLLGYLPTEEEIKNAPLNIDELNKYITKQEYPRIGYNIGPGRGSAVGSLCCYGLGIVDIDPIPYDLLFERFLNVERVSMPDIDSDFRTDIREKVIDYCKAKYGAECICQIMTKSYGATKGNLRLAARYLGSIECSKDEKYKELEAEFKEVSILAVSNPEIKYEKERLQGDIKDFKKQLRSASDDVEKNEITLKIEELENQIVEITEQGETLKTKYSERRDQIQVEMDAYLKTWYNRADKLSKTFDELGGNLPDTEFLSKEEAEIVNLAEKLDGVFTGYGQHAAGTIISGSKLSNIIPLMWNEKKSSMETQCTMAQAEAKGLLKMDFLGLKNLNIITEIIRKPTNKSNMDGRLQDYVERDIILKDPTIYRDIFSTGLTQGIFQFESPGMKKMLMEFKPESFEDIILLVAAYRPGPIDYIPEIIASKWHDKDPNKYPAPKKSISLQNDTLKAILEPTYGCPIYQEQIMQIFQRMAGYSLGGADIVRRYMSKKKEDKLKKEKHNFIYGNEEEVNKAKADLEILKQKYEISEGEEKSILQKEIENFEIPKLIPGCCKLHGISEKDADDLFEQMMPFARYGFNKSHATAYAMVAMFTAYLKKYHTADFFRSSLNATEKLTEIPNFVKEMAAFGLELKAPNMFESKNNFTVNENENIIYYGLRYIKGFSEQNIIPFASIEGFMKSNQHVSLKILETYAKLGMFECCWLKDARTGRARNNRHECLRWIEKNGALVKKYLEHVERIDELSLSRAEFETKMRYATDNEEMLAYEKEFNKISRQISQWTDKLNIIKESLKLNRDNDYANNISNETAEEILENREWEVELLSIPFDIEESLAKIKNCNNKNTFESLKISSNDNNGVKTIYVPAIVLSVSKEKKTKNGKSYYDVMLMDSMKNIVTRRFDTKPIMLDGDFQLTLDEVKYYNCLTNKSKPIVLTHKEKKFVPFNAPFDEKLRMINNGATIESIYTAGRRTVPVLSGTKEIKENDKKSFEPEI